MKRIFSLSTAAMLILGANAWGAGLFCLNCGIHCIQPPPPSCPDCGCACDHGHHWCTKWTTQKAHKLIDELCTGDCCQRIKAARALGLPWCADYCCDPEVLTALIKALLCDSCWEVRRTAAWSIMLQKGRTEPGVLALYVASKLDPHYLVRDRAREALDILIVCRRECYKNMFLQADELIRALRGRYRPGTSECDILFTEFCSAGHIALGNPVPEPIPGPAPIPAKK